MGCEHVFWRAEKEDKISEQDHVAGTPISEVKIDAGGDIPCKDWGKKNSRILSRY